MSGVFEVKMYINILIEDGKMILAADTRELSPDELEQWISLARLLIIKIELFELIDKYIEVKIVNSQSQIDNITVPDDVTFDHR